jgi:hypothetical protein
MRTTIVLDDELVRLAKRRAADTGTTLSHVIAAALREMFRQAPAVQTERFRMVTFGGRRKHRHEPADFARVLEEDDRPARKR